VVRVIETLAPQSSRIQGINGTWILPLWFVQKCVSSYLAIAPSAQACPGSLLVIATNSSGGALDTRFPESNAGFMLFPLNCFDAG
jgi:hypothetical protein